VKFWIITGIIIACSLSALHADGWLEGLATFGMAGWGWWAHEAWINEGRDL
jgi:hypothetical protein